MKLVYIGFAFEHHKDTYAGYNHIKDYIKYDKVIDCQRSRDFIYNKVYKHKLIGYIYKKIFKTNDIWWVDLYLSILLFFSRNTTFHYVHPENTFFYAGRFKNRSNKIVCTYHQPLDVFEKNKIWIKSIKYVDKIILLSQKDIEYFKLLKGDDNLKFIPHGINTNYFAPKFHIKENLIIMIGNWLRDFTFANEVFMNLLDKSNCVKIVVVTNKDNYLFFKPNDRLTLLNNVSNDFLLELYQKAKLLFLPLISYTANNAILEASSCELPILIASNNIDVSYFNTDKINYLDLNVNKVVDFILNSDFSNNDARQYVIENYSWEKIGKITEEYIRDNKNPN